MLIKVLFVPLGYFIIYCIVEFQASIIVTYKIKRLGLYHVGGDKRTDANLTFLYSCSYHKRGRGVMNVQCLKKEHNHPGNSINRSCVQKRTNTGFIQTDFTYMHRKGRMSHRHHNCCLPASSLISIPEFSPLARATRQGFQLI